MSDYAKIKKLDEETLHKLKEGSGPADECLCPLLSSPEPKKGFAASVKRAFSALNKGKSKGQPVERKAVQKSVDVPFGLGKGHAGIRTTREVVKRKGSCGKCGCDKDKIVMKHSYANIRITTPDVSSICPCPSECLPEKEKLQNNIKVVVENARVNSSSGFNVKK